MAEVPFIEKVHKSYYEFGLRVISPGRDWSQPPYTSCSDWSNLGATYPIIDDEISNLFPLFGGPIYPQSVLVNQDGAILYSRLGLFEDEMIALIESNLGITGLDVSGKPEYNKPMDFEIGAPFPNPFNPTVNFYVTLLQEQTLDIQILNLKGQVLKSYGRQVFPVGRSAMTWVADKVPSGTYFIRVDDGRNRIIRRVLLLR